MKSEKGAALSAMGSRTLVLILAVAGFVLGGGAALHAADYASCFAFDPLFIQPDQRVIPSVAATGGRGARLQGAPESPAQVRMPRLTFRAIADLRHDGGDVDGPAAN
jgi:hypothetical protein